MKLLLITFWSSKESSSSSFHFSTRVIGNCTVWLMSLVYVTLIGLMDWHNISMRWTWLTDCATFLLYFQTLGMALTMLKTTWSWYSFDILHRTGHMLTWYLSHISDLLCTVFQHLARFSKISLCLGFVSCCWTRLVVGLSYPLGCFQYISDLPMPVRHISRMHFFEGNLLLQISFCNMFPLKIVSPPGGKWTNANFAQLDSDWHTSNLKGCVLVLDVWLV